MKGYALSNALIEPRFQRQQAEEQFEIDGFMFADGLAVWIASQDLAENMTSCFIFP